MASQRFKNTSGGVCGDDHVDTVVDTVDVAGRSRKLVAVCDEQSKCSENSCDSDGTLRHRGTRVRVSVW